MSQSKLSSLNHDKINKNTCRQNFQELISKYLGSQVLQIYSQNYRIYFVYKNRVITEIRLTNKYNL